MPIDNYNHIVPLLNFEGDDTFYYMQILRRRKDNPHLHKDRVEVNRYFLKDQRSLDLALCEAILIADVLNARVMINLNPRSYRKTALQTMVDLSIRINRGEYHLAQRAFPSTVGKTPTGKLWLIDVDDLSMLGDMQEWLGASIKASIPSKTGLHLITSSFHREQFLNLFPDVTIHLDSPTNLYIP